MNKLKSIALFVRVAELGSFTAAAAELGLAKSIVSKEIARLEQDLNVRLLQRSTRKIQLTEIGLGYLNRSREILAKVEEADAFAQQSQSQPQGRLKINASMALGITVLAPAFAEFMQEYEKITVETFLTDESIDLVEHGFDLGLRAASQVFDSSYIGRPLHEFNYRICASPEYLKAHGQIKSVAALKHHNCFEYTYFRKRNVWPIGDGDGIPINGTLKANSTVYILEAVKAGLGVAFLPEFVCDEAIQEGSVVEVLPRIKRNRLTLYALYPARSYTPPKVISCVEFLQNWFNDK